MKNQQLLEIWHQRPFQPFNIRVSDGRVYTVEHPDFLARSHDGTFVVYTTEDGRVIIIDLAHITTLEVMNRRAG